jgi:hypothetical protein
MIDDPPRERFGNMKEHAALRCHVRRIGHRRQQGAPFIRVLCG